MSPLRQLLPLLATTFLAGCGSVGGGQGLNLGPDQTSLSGSYLQGRFAAQDFDIPRAEEAFVDVARRLPGPAGSRTAFIYALASGSSADAEQQARVVIATDEGEPQDDFGVQRDLPRLTLAAVAMRDGDPEQAITLLSEDDLSSSLSRSLAVLLRSAALYESKGTDAALAALSEQESGTFNALVPQHVAMMMVVDGQASRAETMFRRALGGARADIAALGYARFLEDEGRADEADDIYVRMAQDAGLFTRAGRMGRVRTGSLEEQSREFRRASTRAPRLADDGYDLFALALENYAWLGFEQAMQTPRGDRFAVERRRSALVVPLALSNLAREVDGDRAVANYLSALIVSMFDNPEDALEMASAVKPSSWLYEYARLEVADSVRQAGDANDAVQSLRQDLKRDPGSPQMALQLHGYLLQAERYDEAEDAADMAIAAAEALDVMPSSLWRYYFARGAGRIEADVWEGGRDDLERALELASDEPIILNHLGYSYVERGLQLERAFGMIERALDIDPNNGAIVDSLGWAHFQQGNFDAAIVQLERAVELEPADAVITDHLGDAYYAVGRERDARYEWQRVMTLEDADEELLAEVAAKLGGDTSGVLPPAEREGS
ncbi:MAG: tetratricopeptide repeat protein [Pseudomonadota bacterium]